MRKLSVLLLVLLVCITITCGCTVPSVSPSQPAAPSSQPAVQPAAQSAVPSGPVKNVDIIQRAFDPDIIRVSPGTTVVWTNKDTVNHRVVHLPELPGDRELFHSESFSKGDTFSYTFQTAGRYYYSDPQYAGGRKSLVIVE
jgi:plastocyanin